MPPVPEPPVAAAPPPVPEMPPIPGALADAPPDATIAILPDVPSPGESPDLAFDAPSAPVGGEDLAQAATLDPAGASGFDVSSSDLSVNLDDPSALPLGHAIELASRM